MPTAGNRRDNAEMSTTVEVFAEITCPFAYVGLHHVVDHVAELDSPVDIIVRAWPLEWVNGTGLAFDGVETKAAVLREQHPHALAEIASAHGVEFDPDDDRAVHIDYDNGQARGVKGSPHYFVATNDFFCPALDIGHDADNHLTARFDPDGLARFLASVQL